MKSRRLSWPQRAAGRASIVSWLVGLLAAITPVSALAEADEGPLPTFSELRQMSDAGQFRVCLRQIARVLRLAEGSKGYDRYELLLLRGDCLLHIEDPATAQLAYAAAKESPVSAQANEARATVLLIARSVKMTYVPRTANETGDGINIASRANRIKALGALLQDEIRADRREMDRAIAAQDLVPIREVLPKLADLYAVERATTEGDANVRPILKAVGARARVLIDRELGLEGERVAAIERRANQRLEFPAVGVSSGGGTWWGGINRRGLYTNDRRELRDLIAYLRQIEETTKLGQRIALSFDGDVKAWDPLIERASKVLQHSNDVLDSE